MTTDKQFPDELLQFRHDLVVAGFALDSARKSVDNAVDVLAARVRAAVAAGVPEKTAAELAMVSRTTVRAWLGK